MGTSAKLPAAKTSRDVPAGQTAAPRPGRREALQRQSVWGFHQRGAAVAFAEIFEMPSLERAGLVKSGTPARVVNDISREMDITKERFVRITGLPRATVTRKIAGNKDLSSDESERIVGLAKLIGQVETMVRESGDASGFKPAKWFSAWIAEPIAALGGRRPEELLDTADGRDTVSRLLAQMQSGAYA